MCVYLLIIFLLDNSILVYNIIRIFATFNRQCAAYVKEWPCDMDRKCLDAIRYLNDKDIMYLICKLFADQAVSALAVWGIQDHLNKILQKPLICIWC